MSFEVINPRELPEYMGRRDVIIVDLRDREDYLEYHLNGAVNIPYDELENRKKWLERYRVVLFYCDRGNVSLLAARDLKDWGSKVITVSGGVRQFRKLFK